MWKYLLEKEFKQFFRDPGLPRMALAFPVLMMLVFDTLTTYISLQCYYRSQEDTRTFIDWY